MAPMIADATDAATLLELAERARTGLEADGIAHGEVALGVMLEIPSAILVADSYFGRIAFGSLGTNDLLQYTLAVDRGNPQLERYQDSLHPALLGLVARSVEAAERAGIELSVCGEMAGDATAALALVGLGITRLSMSGGSLPEVRRTIRGSDFAEMRMAAGEALREPSAVAVRARFEALRAGAPPRGRPRSAPRGPAAPRPRRARRPRSGSGGRAGRRRSAAAGSTSRRPCAILDRGSRP